MSTSAESPISRSQCASVAETESHGEAIGRRAQSGEVYGLSGDLGAGKTAWVRGFARGVGYRGRVHSPTFALLNEYEGGRLTVHHLDLYRLGSPAEVAGAGLEEYLVRPDGVSVVEWIDRWAFAGSAPVPGQRLHRLTFRTVSPEVRELFHDPPRV
jgi:tRNA threonylcarbamoyladenosine biosynthesis protein TsaE